MPGKWGGKAVATALRKLPRTKKRKRKARKGQANEIALSRSRKRAKLGLIHTGPVSPGHKLRPQATETTEQMIGGFRKSGLKIPQGKNAQSHKLGHENNRASDFGIGLVVFL